MSCLCNSGSKNFVFVDAPANYASMIDSGCVQVISEEDFQAIQGCLATKSLHYRTGLVFNWHGNPSPNCQSNTVNSYYWGISDRNSRRCVNGTPVTTTENRPQNNTSCQLATLSLSSSLNIPNVTWTPCNEKHPYVCQNETLPSINGVMLQNIPACSTSISDNESSSLNNKTPLIAGIVSGLCVIIVLILLFYCLCYRKSKPHAKKK